MLGSLYTAPVPHEKYHHNHDEGIHIPWQDSFTQMVDIAIDIALICWLGSYAFCRHPLHHVQTHPVLFLQASETSKLIDKNDTPSMRYP